MNTRDIHTCANIWTYSIYFARSTSLVFGVINQRKNWWLCYAVGSILLLAWFRPVVPLKVRFTANQYKVIPTDHLYPMMKCFYPERSGHVQDDPSPIHSTGWLRLWMVWWRWHNGLQSPDLNPVENLWETLEWRVTHYLHHQNAKWWSIFGKMDFIPPLKFQRLVESVYWSCSGGSWWPNTLLPHLMVCCCFFPFVTHI